MTIIKSFKVSAADAEKSGLKELNISRVGRVVAFAGKNGSGKSRILTALISSISDYKNYSFNKAHVDSEIERYQGLVNSTQEANKQHLVSWRNTLDSNEKIRDGSLRLEVAPEVVLNYLKFVPKNLSLTDPRAHSTSEQEKRYKQTVSIGAENHDYCLFYIQECQDLWREATHPTPLGTLVDPDAEESYLALDNLILSMLGIRLERIERHAGVFGRPIAEAGLSDGQKIILQLCVAIHAQKSNLENTVFVLDEPENHLHPSASIDLFKAIYESSESSQIWIATHSVPLLAYVFSVEPMSLWYVDGGSASNSGRNPKAVLESLLGDDDQIGRLNAFTGLPAILATVNYAAECLLPPKVIGGSGSKDPQASQIQTVIYETAKEKSRIKVLEFGAGEGRLLDSLAVESLEHGIVVSDFVDYYAYEPYPNGDVCVKIIEKYYENPEERFFKGVDSYFTAMEDSSVDVLMMCNVLHEISPAKWIEMFSEGSLIMRALNDSGYLLLVEDQRLPTGEHAHEYGFVLLDTPQLKTLFGVDGSDLQGRKFVVDSRRDGRLKAHLISKSVLSRINCESRRKAIEQLAKSAKNNVRELKGLGGTYQNGMLYGFWVQQFVNSSMCLEEL